MGRTVLCKISIASGGGRATDVCVSRKVTTMETFLRPDDTLQHAHVCIHHQHRRVRITYIASRPLIGYAGVLFYRYGTYGSTSDTARVGADVGRHYEQRYGPYTTCHQGCTTSVLAIAIHRVGVCRRQLSYSNGAFDTLAVANGTTIWYSW